jgi:phosphatidate cytidylyltransferase
MTESALSQRITPAPRGGRNLTIATVVGVALLALVVLALTVRKDTFVLIAIVACALALRELATALAARGIHVPLLPLLVGSVGILVSSYTAGTEALLVSFLLTAGGVVVWRVIDGGGMIAMRDASAGTFAAAYIPFLAGFVMLMLSENDGAPRVLLFILLVVANDVGGYAAGSLVGRHRMAPRISPNKTWEGLVGSVILALSVGIVAGNILLHLSIVNAVIVAAAAVVTATLGDLAESSIKRDLALKDMSDLLPGHGGVLDRLDSLLVAAPVTYLLLLILHTPGVS